MVIDDVYDEAIVMKRVKKMFKFFHIKLSDDSEAHDIKNMNVYEADQFYKE